ncbi:MAG: hypothetical protein ACI88G_001665 [Woeseiaceae bacterium]|jgi:hypothetical protein
MSIKKRKTRIIWPSDPEYLDWFYKHWGSGQSLTSPQASRSVEQESPPEPQELPQHQPAQDPSQPSDGRQEDHLLANTESGED